MSVTTRTRKLFRVLLPAGSRGRAKLAFAVACATTGALGGGAGCSTLLGIAPGSLADDGGVDAATSLPDGGVSESDAADDFVVGFGGQTRVTVVRGSSARVVVSAAKIRGRVGAITVTGAALPAGVTADPLVIQPGATTGTLTLRASAGATLTVTGSLALTATSGGVTHPATIPLFVQDPPGTLDSTFGVGGISTVTLAGGLASAGIGGGGLAIQPDGQIVFCGNALFGQSYELVLGRLTTSGRLDPGFGTGGLVVMNQPGHSVDTCGAVRILPSGSMAVGGFTLVPNNPTYPHAVLAAQFTAEGKPDPMFGRGGFFSLDLGGVDSKANDLVVQPDGKLVLGGFSGSSFALIRLLPTGAIDGTFGPASDGTLRSTLPGSGQIASLALLSSGAVLATVSAPSLLAVQFTAAGLIDASYGTSGHASVPSGAVPFAAPAGVVVQPDGKSVLTGTTTASGSVPGGVQLARFRTDGQLDAAFGQGGVATTTFPGGNARAGSIALLPDGSFAVCAGLPTSTPIGVIRYDARGGLDTRFAGVGYAGIAGTSQGNAVAIDDAGRILLAAFTQNAANDTAAVVVARFWP